MRSLQQQQQKYMHTYQIGTFVQKLPVIERIASAKVLEYFLKIVETFLRNLDRFLKKSLR